MVNTFFDYGRFSDEIKKLMETDKKEFKVGGFNITGNNGNIQDINYKNTLGKEDNNVYLKNDNAKLSHNIEDKSSELDYANGDFGFNIKRIPDWGNDITVTSGKFTGNHNPDSMSLSNPNFGLTKYNDGGLSGFLRNDKGFEVGFTPEEQYAS